MDPTLAKASLKAGASLPLILVTATARPPAGFDSRSLRADAGRGDGVLVAGRGDGVCSGGGPRDQPQAVGSAVERLDGKRSRTARRRRTGGWQPLSTTLQPGQYERTNVA